MKQRIVLALALAVMAGGSACADRIPKLDTSAPVPVDVGLVPGKSNQDLTVDLDTSKEVRSALKSTGSQVLVGDVRLWNIHHGQRLVGALQLATLKQRIDPRRADDRNEIVTQVLGSRPRQLVIGGVPVWTVPDDGTARQIFVFFGARSFGVLQVKGVEINAGELADDLIHKIASQPGWHPLAPQDYEKKAST